MSESHQRQLLLASENPTKFMDYFSEWVTSCFFFRHVCDLMKKIISLYSCCFSPSEFKSDFLELLRRRFGEMGFASHPDVSAAAAVLSVVSYKNVFAPFSSTGTKRVHNNIVYNEYISHREHIHMNSTQWETLTDFTKWLGREGKLVWNLRKE